jgi:hypothetical protein
VKLHAASWCGSKTSKGIKVVVEVFSWRRFGPRFGPRAAPNGRVRKTRSQRCNRTKPVRVNWSRNTVRKVDSRETTRHWGNMPCTDRCAGFDAQSRC